MLRLASAVLLRMALRIMSAAWLPLASSVSLGGFAQTFSVSCQSLFMKSPIVFRRQRHPERRLAEASDDSALFINRNRAVLGNLDGDAPEARPPGRLCTCPGLS